MVSTIVAGRIPIIITPFINATELNAIGGYGIITNIEIPEILLEVTTKLKYLLLKNKCVILPSHEYIDTNLAGSDYTDITVFNTKFIQDDWDIFSNSPQIVDMINPDRVNGTITFQVARPYFYIPNSNYINISEIDEYKLNYSYYIKTIESLAVKLQSAKSENEIDLILKEIDIEFLKLDIECKKLHKKLNWRGVEVIVGLCATLVSICIPNSAEIIKYIVSSSAAWTGVKYLKEKANYKEGLKQSPYWFPWHFFKKQKYK